MLNQIRAVLTSLRSILTHAEPRRHPLMDSLNADVLEKTSPQTPWLNSGFEHELNSELAETRNIATSVLETLVKRSEQERRRMELMFNRLDVAFILCDKNAIITATNLAARKALNVSTHSLLGQRLDKAFPGSFEPEALTSEYVNFLSFVIDAASKAQAQAAPTYDDLEESFKEYCRTCDSLLGRHINFKYKRDDGVVLQLEMVLNPLTLDPREEEFGYIVVLHDLTQAKSAAAEVSRLRSVNSGLMSVSPIPLFNKDAGLRFTFANSQFQRLVALGEDDIVGKKSEQLFDSDSARILNELDERTLASAETQQTALRMVTQAGGVHDAKVFSRSIRQDGVAVGLTGSIMLDCSDKGVRESVFEAAAVAVVFVGADGKITGCNDEFLRLCQHTKDEIINRTRDHLNLAEFVPADLNNLLSDSIRVDNREYSRLCSPTLDREGNVEGIVCVFCLRFFVDTEK